MASKRAQLWLAASLWSIVGVTLASFGAYWLLSKADYQGFFLLVVAAFVGLGKSLLILDRTAHRLIRRVQLRGEDRCVGGFLSLQSWALIAVMMLLGKLLRTLPVPRSVLGLIYAAVGAGLLVSSRGIWRAWQVQSLEENSGTGCE